MAVRYQVAPLPGKSRVEHIEQAVEEEEPHEQKMPCHSLRQPLIQVIDRGAHHMPGGVEALKGMIKQVREERQQRTVAEADPIYLIGPIDAQAAPYHHAQNRKVDPVEPADRQRMLLLKSFHAPAFPDVRLEVTSCPKG